MLELESIVRRAMSPVTVSRVELRETTNRDEERALWVTVYYVGYPDGLSVETMRATTDAVWGAADIDHITPVVSFVSEEDATLEAAE